MRCKQTLRYTKNICKRISFSTICQVKNYSYCQKNETNDSSFLAPKPECVSDPECPTQLACINEKCKNPCYSHTCGRNAECTVKNHRPICVCLQGFVGNPQTICEERKFYYWNQFIPNRISLKFFHIILIS